MNVFVNQEPQYRRSSLRLRQYDHRQAGAYFVTVNVQDRSEVLSQVTENEIVLTTFGQIVNECWTDLPQHYPHVALDQLVVMPDHVHGIVFISEDIPSPSSPAGPTQSPRSSGAEFQPDLEAHGDMRRHGLSEIVRSFKTFSARRINEMSGTTGRPFWQRGFYDHGVRDEQDLDRIRRYIAENPAKWWLMKVGKRD